MSSSIAHSFLPNREVRPLRNIFLATIALSLAPACHKSLPPVPSKFIQFATFNEIQDSDNGYQLVLTTYEARAEDLPSSRFDLWVRVNSSTLERVEKFLRAESARNRWPENLKQHQAGVLEHRIWFNCTVLTSPPSDFVVVPKAQWLDALGKINRLIFQDEGRPEHIVLLRHFLDQFSESADRH